MNHLYWNNVFFFILLSNSDMTPKKKKKTKGAREDGLVDKTDDDLMNKVDDDLAKDNDMWVYFYCVIVIFHFLFDSN